MAEAQGHNISEWQAQQRHQERQGGKSGFGLGHADSVATVVEGVKWMFSFHEGAIPAYSNALEGLISGSSLATLFGKSDNMFGIKFFENLAEYFSGSGGEEDVLLKGTDMGHSDGRLDSGDYPYANKEIAHSVDGLQGICSAGDHHGQFFSPGTLLSVGDSREHELGG